MSTTDTRAAFEAWMREEYDADDDMLKKPYEGRYFWPRAADAWIGWQAALSLSRSAAQESAPAELPPLPKPDTHCFDEDTNKDVWSHSADQMREYSQACIAVVIPRPVVAESFADWLAREMPAGTVIGDPAWWAVKIGRAFAAAPASPQPVAKVLNDTDIESIWLGLPGIEIHNKAASTGMNTQCALRIAFARAILAASTPTTLTEKKE